MQSEEEEEEEVAEEMRSIKISMTKDQTVAIEGGGRRMKTQVKEGSKESS